MSYPKRPAIQTIVLLGYALLLGTLVACNADQASKTGRSNSAPSAPPVGVPSPAAQTLPGTTTTQELKQNLAAKPLADQTQDQLPERTSGEQYSTIQDNPFQRASTNPLSTFSIDVDAASYSNVRRFINEGQLPPKDAVRIEEMINYFTYDYPQPQGDRPFTVTTEVGTAPWNRNHRLVLVGLQGKRMALESLPPSNLVFLIDVSGSMDAPNRLPLVKSGLRLLVNELRASDRVTIVVYAGNAGVVLPPTPGNQKEAILAALDRLQAGGSTAGGEGIQLAYKLAKENFLKTGNNRVILATDGDFNVGISSDAELVNLIEQKRNEGVYLTVLGFGMGNLQDAKLEQLADKGNGNYAYIDSLLEARKVFVKELGSTLFTIAKDVKIQVEFNPAKVQAYRLIGYENRILASQDFSDDKKDAGEMGAGHSVTALYEILPAGIKSDVPLAKEAAVQDKPSVQFKDNEIMVVKLRYKPPQQTTSQFLSQLLLDQGTPPNPSPNLRFSAAVAAFGMILRDSPYKGTATLDNVLQLAQQSQGTDLDGYRAEFIRLVEKSKTLL
ncbi:hypothetical protein BST81_23860 [Leptolyngbya sp. 'hensonii']|uniref:vWA domain-containing protein n=1 Tax=Leptolyngbya sp. 'hensonii' TaxID=1922337 RepID=UPI00094F9FFF|nr:VWA domain-containing protein [Leptolyngbya sp. 'hensonii']OLP15864.1 hypothetical protein BST81_23860 [Leptolyngbya sp. 'hensonii']